MHEPEQCALLWPAVYSWGIAALACTDFAMLMDVREITSVWKKFSMLLRKGSAFAATLPARSLNACMSAKSPQQVLHCPTVCNLSREHMLAQSPGAGMTYKRSGKACRRCDFKPASD